MPATKLPFDPSHPVATFGPTIAAKLGNEPVWLPSGMLIDSASEMLG